jgi:ribosomal protein L16/L10AE
MTDEMKDAMKVVRLKKVKPSPGPKDVIYTGIEEANTIFSNYVEIANTKDHFWVKFFHQRPIRRAPAESQFNDGKMSMRVGNFDTLETALQQGVALTPQAAVMLFMQLEMMLNKRAKQSGQDEGNNDPEK